MWEIRRLEEADFPRWDAFVEACPEGTFFHLAGWKRAIDETFGHPTHYLYAQRER